VRRLAIPRSRRERSAVGIVSRVQEYADRNGLDFVWEYTPAFAKRQRLLTPEQYEIVDSESGSSGSHHHSVGNSRSSAFSQARKALMAFSLRSCVWEFSSWWITRSRSVILRPLCSRTYLTASSIVSILRRVSEAERMPRLGSPRT
jgi:hypothetical protein